MCYFHDKAVTVQNLNVVSVLSHLYRNAARSVRDEETPVLLAPGAARALSRRACARAGLLPARFGIAFRRGGKYWSFALPKYDVLSVALYNILYHQGLVVQHSPPHPPGSHPPPHNFSKLSGREAAPVCTLRHPTPTVSYGLFFLRRRGFGG
jgi:hypothetical protein